MNHLTTLRKAAKIKSGKKAAKLLSVSLSTISKLENNKRKPSLVLAIRMCNVYKCTLNDIIMPYIDT